MDGPGILASLAHANAVLIADMHGSSAGDLRLFLIAHHESQRGHSALAAI